MRSTPVVPNPQISTPKTASSCHRKAGSTKKLAKKLLRRHELEQELVPYQVELLKLQSHLERHQRRMIVVFEGRDASGKGGTIRRVTRFMNVKHYRIVALGKPTEDERSQWYLQRYVAQFPRGGEMVLFDRSWYNRGDG